MSVKKCCVCGKVRWVQYVAQTNDLGKNNGINSVKFPLCMKCYINLVKNQQLCVSHHTFKIKCNKEEHKDEN